MKIGCLGDSNTFPFPVPSWPEYAAQLAPQHAWLNYGLGGGTVCDPDPPYANAWWWAKPQLDTALAAGCTHIITAFGTNDIRILNKTRDEIITAYCVVKNTCDAAGVIFFVATTPQCTELDSLYQPRIDALNLRHLLLQKNVPGWNLVDFDSGDADLLSIDGVHVTPPAQQVRASRAIAALAMYSAGETG